MERPTLRRLKSGHDNVTACWESWLAAMCMPCRGPGAIWSAGAWEAWSAARRHWTFTVTADGGYFGSSQGSAWPISARIGATQHTPNSARLGVINRPNVSMHQSEPPLLHRSGGEAKWRCSWGGFLLEGGGAGSKSPGRTPIFISNPSSSWKTCRKRNTSAMDTSNRGSNIV